MIQRHVFVFFFIFIYLNINIVEVKSFRTSNNPDTYLTPTKIIKRNGYPAEAHIIQSADGYLLEYHRIPFGKAGPNVKKTYPILLHHGLLCSSIDWIINGPEKSLAYQLADDGHDVWMANARGNTYSRSHVSLNPKQKEFWNYTFHEMGIYDLPAAIDYILNITNSSRLIYIGHSLGTTIFFVFSSSRPDYNNKILVQLSIAPVAMLSHTTSAFRHLVPFAKEINMFSDWYSQGAFLEYDSMTKVFLEFFCGAEIFNFNICEQLVIFKLFGKDVQQFNKSLTPVIMSHMPSGTSSKNMIHCSQLISSGKFALYDYGLSENIKRYHSAKPPLYDLSQISVPILFYHSSNDILANPTDVQLLYRNIPKPMGCVLIKYEKWNHVDFLWGINVNPLFNDQLRQFVKNVTNSPNFILNRVKSALTERNQQPITINEPVNEENFLNNKFNGIYTLGNVTKLIKVFTDANTSLKLPNSEKREIVDHVEDLKNEILENVNKLEKVVKENIERTSKHIHVSFENSAIKMKDVAETNLLAAKGAVESSIVEIDNKIKEGMKKLENFLSYK